MSRTNPPIDLNKFGLLCRIKMIICNHCDANQMFCDNCKVDGTLDEFKAYLKAELEREE